MHPKRYTFLAATALGLALAAPLAAQDTAPAPEVAPAEAAPDAAAPEAAAPDAATAPVQDPEAAPAPDADADADAPEAAEPAAPAAPAPNITVTEHGDWEVGCMTGTTNCEMQQVAADPQGNPVILARLVKLPADAEAKALAIFNTPLGTLLPTGIRFQIDTSPEATLPFEWCVQEGCVVRLGLRDAEIASMKRGRNVKLTVISIADPEQPVVVNLSLAGFTAAFDSLAVPPNAPETPAAAPAAAPAADQ